MCCRERKERILLTLRQVEHSILLLQEWNKGMSNADDYLLSPEGTKNLAASCMLIEAIGEAYKRIDKETEGLLLPHYTGIPWKAVKGIRDRIAHGYFEIDAQNENCLLKSNVILHCVPLDDKMKVNFYFDTALSKGMP